MNRPSTPQADYRVGSVDVFVAEGRLRSPLGARQLQPRIMAVLVELCRNAGQVVSREALHQAVWGDSVVTDHALARCVSVIRSELSALEGGADGKSIVSALRKRGYRLELPVDSSPLRRGTSTEPSSSKRGYLAVLAALFILVLGLFLIRGPAPESTLPMRSVAVLPFLNLTGDESYDYLSDGFSEQLSHALANVNDLKVAARTSAFYFRDHPAEIPEIARMLDVEALLEGSIRRQDERFRITVQLVREDGFHLWSREFDRTLADILTLQNDIANQVLNELGLSETKIQEAQVTASTDNFLAFDEYVRGRFALSRGPAAYPEAEAHFRAAIEHDPTYALAYTGLTDTFGFMLARRQISAEEATQRIEPLLQKAFDIEPFLAEAHASRGLFFFGLGRFEDAEQALLTAISIKPNYVNAHSWLGISRVYNDRFSAGAEAYRQALQFNPMDLPTNRNLGVALLLSGKPDEGFNYLERVRELEPARLGTYYLLANWSLNYGRLEKALRWSDIGLSQDENHTRLLAARLASLSLLGNGDEAEEVAKKLVGGHRITIDVLGFIAHYWFANGRPDQVLALLGSSELPEVSTTDVSSQRIRLTLQARALMAQGDTDQAFALLDGETPDIVSCSAGGWPGSRLYFAALLRDRNRGDEADTLVQSCVEQVQETEGKGAAHPRLIYRTAVNQLQAGNPTAAAATLQRAIDFGWREAPFVVTDPLWSEWVAAPEFAELFAQAEQLIALERAKASRDAAWHARSGEPH